MRAAFVYERRTHRPISAGRAEGTITLRSAALRYAAAAGVIAVAGSWLPFVGEEIATTMGWKTTLVGTPLIAGTTSVPELVVTISALRRGAEDMAIGSLLGSNLFDILIVAVDDLAYRKGPLLLAVSPAHAITAVAGTIMSGIFIVAMFSSRRHAWAARSAGSAFRCSSSICPAPMRSTCWAIERRREQVEHRKKGTGHERAV